MIHELLVWDLKTRLREVTRVVDEVNGSGSGHDEDGGAEHGQSGEEDERDEIVLEMKPNLVKVVWG